MIPLRSLLFAPGNNPRKLDRVSDFDADAFVYDLEDAVPEEDKQAARLLVSSALRRSVGGIRMVRVNAASTGQLEADLDVAVSPNTWGIVVPKVEKAAELARIDDSITQAETTKGLVPGAIRLLALIETARGLLSLPEIATTLPGRFERFVLGSVDLAADLGLPVGERRPAEIHAATSLLIASRAARLAPPLDGPYTNLADAAGYETDCTLSHQLGFVGRILLHPDQISTAHAAYDISEIELLWARRVTSAYEKAVRKGSGSISLDGQFIDRSVYVAALRTLGVHD